MLTLSYGFFKPETGDPGSTWFPNLSTNFQKLNDHLHTGASSDSALLSPVAIGKFTSTIAAADWSSDGGGNYSKVVTVPSGISAAVTYNDFYTYGVICKISTTGATKGDIVYPQIEWESATTFTVRVNDNTLDLIIYYF